MEWRMLEWRNRGLHGKEVGNSFFIWTIVDLVYRFEEKLK